MGTVLGQGGRGICLGCGKGSQDSNTVSPRTKPEERTKRKRTKERNKRSLCVSCGLPETPKKKKKKKALLNLCSLLLPGLGAAKDDAGRSKDARMLIAPIVTCAVLAGAARL